MNENDENLLNAKNLSNNLIIFADKFSPIACITEHFFTHLLLKLFWVLAQNQLPQQVVRQSSVKPSYHLISIAHVGKKDVGFKSAKDFIPDISWTNLLTENLIENLSAPTKFILTHFKCLNEKMCNCKIFPQTSTTLVLSLLIVS